MGSVVAEACGGSSTTSGEAASVEVGGTRVTEGGRGELVRVDDTTVPALAL